MSVNSEGFGKAALMLRLAKALSLVAYLIWVTSRENLSSGFPTRLDTNWAVLPQKMASGLKCWI